MCETFPPNQQEDCNIPRASIKVGWENRLQSNQDNCNNTNGVMCAHKVLPFSRLGDTKKGYQLQTNYLCEVVHTGLLAVGLI